MADVWLVGDEPRLKESLVSVAGRVDPKIAFHAVFSTAGQVLEALDRGRVPDVALIDLGLPDVSGVELIARMLARCPELVLIALTVRVDDAAVFGALRAGAVGYLLEDSPPEAIVRAIHDAVAGGSPLSPSIARRVVRQLQPDADSLKSFDLTSRELQVLELLCSGASYREVAATLGVTEGTVHTHVKRVYDKIGAGNKADAVRIAFDARLVPLRYA